ncbi:S-layer homology domain-containing protein [Wukongibacter baidiensis]|uniref:S-layer homology domain-containing protein n=1 Tax=Wukongibacter baidiensis TaxID=1723361 RepID=UPI003D7F8D72
MKRIVSFMVAVLLIASVSMTDTYAMGKNYKHFYKKSGNKKGNTSVVFVKQFYDIDGYDWAERAIEKMAIKGVIKGNGNGNFAPKRAVTKLESIIMALRVMGYEDLAKVNLDRVRRGTKKLKNKNRIEEWAYGYIVVALEKGILDEVDLIEMNLKAPAQRHEVAKYIIRALGYEDEAQEYMKKELRFIDAGAVPLGSVGYVYLADKKGIISGYPDKTFRPSRAVTRAEMAVLIARLDDKVDSDIDENEEFAEIVKIKGDELSLKVDNKIKTYEILENTPVYTEDGKYVSTDELSVGMKVKIQLNDKKTIIFIEIKEYEEEVILDIYEGEVEEIEDDEITIKVNKIQMTFDIEDDVEVEFKNRDGSLEDIEEGDEVKVRLNEDEEIEYIKVYRDLEESEYEGEVEEIEDDEITIKVNKVEMAFEIENDVEVEFKNREGSVKDIEEGDEVKVRLNEDEEIEYIKVYRDLEESEYEGEVEEIEDDEITIKVNKVEMTFEMENDVEVEFKNREGSVKDIEEGDEVKVRLNEDEEIEYIKVYRDLEESEYEGEVEEIEDDEITIKVNKIEMTFEIEDDVKVEFKNGKGSIDDIKEGDEVKVRVDDEEVEYIKVYRELDYDVYEGLFIEFDDDKLLMSTSKEVVKFEVDSDVQVIFEDKEGDIEDLTVGDEIKVIVDEDDDDEVKWIEVDRDK